MWINIKISIQQISIIYKLINKYNHHFCIPMFVFFVPHEYINTLYTLISNILINLVIECLFIIIIIIISK